MFNFKTIHNMSILKVKPIPHSLLVLYRSVAACHLGYPIELDEVKQRPKKSEFYQSFYQFESGSWIGVHEGIPYFWSKPARALCKIKVLAPFSVS